MPRNKTLAAARADREGSTKNYSPEDALKEVLARIAEGDLDLEEMVILGFTSVEAGAQELFVHRSRTTYSSEVGLLTMALHEAVGDWQI